MLLPAEFQPHLALRPYVKCYWTITGSAPVDGSEGTHGRPVQFLPDSSLKLSFNLVSPVGFSLHNGRKLNAFRGAVCGALTHNYWVRMAGRVDSIGVQFLPGGAYPFIPFAVDSLTNAVYDLDQVWGIAGRRFTETLHRPGLDTAGRLELLEAELLKRLARFKKCDAVFEYAVGIIAANKGWVSLGALCRQLALSRRQLERKFYQKCGMTPKRLCRILRFRHLFEHICAHPAATWADAALCCGYYDQAHLIRDFNFFTGMSPGAFVREVIRRNRLINWGYDMDALARFGLRGPDQKSPYER